MKLSLFSRQRGQKASFEELLMPHMEQLYRLAYHYSGNRHDAEDLVQDLLVKLYPRVAELQRVEHLRPWLTKSLYRLFIDRVRSQQRNPVSAGYDEQMDSHCEEGGGAQWSAQRMAVIRDLQGALSTLPEEQRLLIVMHDVEAYTLAELETILDTPVGTLKSRLHRSRAKLRQLLGEGTLSLERAC